MISVTLVIQMKKDQAFCVIYKTTPKENLHNTCRATRKRLMTLNGTIRLSTSYIVIGTPRI